MSDFFPPENPARLPQTVNCLLDATVVECVIADGLGDLVQQGIVLGARHIDAAGRLRATVERCEVDGDLRGPAVLQHRALRRGHDGAGVVFGFHTDREEGITHTSLGLDGGDRQTPFDGANNPHAARLHAAIGVSDDGCDAARHIRPKRRDIAEGREDSVERYAGERER